MVPSHREGRELQDKDHRSRTQEETTQRPQAPLEPRGGNNSRNLEPGSLQKATGKESNLDPPPLKEPSKWSLLAAQRRRDSQNQQRTKKQLTPRNSKE